MIKELADIANREVTGSELRDALERPIPPDERDEVESLIRWFTTRYPRPEDRLAYVRQAYERWTIASTARSSSE